MNIELFGRKLSINLENKNKPKEKRKQKDIEKSKREILNEKIAYLVLIFAVFVFSSSQILTIKVHLEEGKVATKDIVAPTDIEFIDREAKEKIIERTLKESKKEYIFVENVEKEVMTQLNYIIDVFKENIESSKTTNDLKDIIEGKIPEPIREDIIIFFKGKNEKELEDLRIKYSEDLKRLYKYHIKKEKKKISLDKYYEMEKIEELIERKLFNQLVKPNYVIDEEKTRKEIQERIDQIKDIQIKIKAGSIIVSKGEMITSSKVRILKNAGLYGYTREVVKLLGTTIYFIIITILFFKSSKNFLYKEIRGKNKYKAIFLLILVAMLAIRLVGPSIKYLLPIETVFLLLGILINARGALTIGAAIILYVLPITRFEYTYLVIQILSLVMVVYLTKRIKNRTEIINAGINLGAIKAFFYLSIALSLNFEFMDSLLKSSLLFLSGAFSGMLTMALLPYFEKTFNILTDIKLLELGDLSQPLLRKLSMNAPGTFQHSMMVATLSERATEAIGGNHIFARVASYYHDVGKMKRPQFYVENQADGVNPHNNISPSLSTLIITSHTKDGDELGKEYGIPKEIRDIMYEHQGTTLLAYFYNKAKQENPKLDENSFRYGGPKPRSKESAVIMLADSIEAAVRSLDNKSPLTIEKMLRKIITSKIEAGQLSDADLTFKEIEIIIETFTMVLMSIHHVRIKYPGQK